MFSDSGNFVKGDGYSKKRSFQAVPNQDFVCKSLSSLRRIVLDYCRRVGEIEVND